MSYVLIVHPKPAFPWLEKEVETQVVMDLASATEAIATRGLPKAFCFHETFPSGELVEPFVRQMICKDLTGEDSFPADFRFEASSPEAVTGDSYVILRNYFTFLRHTRGGRKGGQA